MEGVPVKLSVDGRREVLLLLLSNRPRPLPLPGHAPHPTSVCGLLEGPEEDCCVEVIEWAGEGRPSSGYHLGKKGLNRSHCTPHTPIKNTHIIMHTHA